MGSVDWCDLPAGVLISARHSSDPGADIARMLQLAADDLPYSSTQAERDWLSRRHSCSTNKLKLCMQNVVYATGSTRSVLELLSCDTL